ncbi:7-cyano-7-deazaguanine synthase [Brevibacillus invocatus]|uniref:7-cyano-7-deazaguanine synthase n=1 Tax=Brevibacillus invocatus TaxID=173959 RepID=UPI00203CDBE3|nr:7-cyano-7-deazaguanine synthase [Brevibacillus invocatus]MCM3081688.1 7-cyano-7-deazaguanine synthase [Brevibacillus invocatus]MCM3432096.1 7-cyano-7-deazaguanine synthase [Brevibacillus invocatus]
MVEKSQTNEVLILLSGGIDSTSLVHYHLSNKEEIAAIYFDYGQLSCEREYQSAIAISKHYDFQLRRVNLGFTIRDQEGEFYCRNALFVLAACSFLENSQSYISIGVHSETPYYDSTPAFIKDTQMILDGYFGGVIRITAPFLEYSKAKVYEYALKEKVPIHLTYSCEMGQQEPCGICLSCIDRRMLDEKPPGKD